MGLHPQPVAFFARTTLAGIRAGLQHSPSGHCRRNEVLNIPGSYFPSCDSGDVLSSGCTIKIDPTNMKGIADSEVNSPVWSHIEKERRQGDGTHLEFWL